MLHYHVLTGQRESDEGGLRDSYQKIQRYDDEKVSFIHGICMFAILSVRADNRQQVLYLQCRNRQTL